MKKKDAEDALLDQGLRKGVITFDELNEIFPAGYFPLEEMERLLSCLEAHGVKVVEHPGSRKKRLRHRVHQTK